MESARIPGVGHCVPVALNLFERFFDRFVDLELEDVDVFGRFDHAVDTPLRRVLLRVNHLTRQQENAGDHVAENALRLRRRIRPLLIRQFGEKSLQTVHER